MPTPSNFRDLGGLPTASGSALPHGIYMRSAKLDTLTPQQCQEFCQRHHIACIIDLRTPLEAEEFPDPVPPGVQYHSLPLLTEQVVGITHETGSDPAAILRRLRHQPEEIRKILPDYEALYRLMMTHPYALAHVQEALRIIQDNASQGRGTLFHCTAGKDRTGILALHLLRQLGVPEEAILRDYLRTNVSAFPSALYRAMGTLLMTRNIGIARAIFHCYMASRPIMTRIMEEYR